MATGSSSAARSGSGSASRSALGVAPRDLSCRTSSAASPAEPPKGTISRPSSSWQTWEATSAASRAAGVLSGVVASATPVKPASISRRMRSASGTALPARGGSLSSASGPWKRSSSADFSADSTKAASSRASSGPTSSAEPLGRARIRGAPASRAARANPALAAGAGATSAKSSAPPGSAAASRSRALSRSSCRPASRDTAMAGRRAQTPSISAPRRRAGSSRSRTGWWCARCGTCRAGPAARR